VKYTCPLLPVNCAEFSIPDREFPVTVSVPLINENMARAVHRFKDILSIVGIEEIHIFTVEFIMP